MSSAGVSSFDSTTSTNTIHTTDFGPPPPPTPTAKISPSSYRHHWNNNNNNSNSSIHEQQDQRRYNMTTPPPTKPATPQLLLEKDPTHSPKTRGSFGMLLVGVGEYSSMIAIAGILAHRMKLHWYGPQGQGKSSTATNSTFFGSKTQQPLEQSDPFGGFAKATMAAIGGWVRAVRILCILFSLYGLIYCDAFVCCFVGMAYFLLLPLL